MNYLTLEINRRYGLLASDNSQSAANRPPRFRIDAVSANPGGVMSDIWRIIPQPLKMITDLIMRALLLTCQEGSATSVMGAIMPRSYLQQYSRRNLESKPGGYTFHAAIPYLVPYNSLFSSFTFSAELLGPYACPHFSQSSNPAQIEDIAKNLWEFSTNLCTAKVKEAWKGTPEKLEDFEELMRD